MKKAYTYLVLRYVHDIVSGEQLNVGVVVYSPKAEFLGALCRPTYARLSRAFPGLRGESFKAIARYIQSELERIAEQLQTTSSREAVSPPTILEIATRVLPRDESSFQWSSPALGVSDNLSQTLEELYERLVTRFDEREQAERRSDEDVWRYYKKDLEARRLLQRLRPKTITTKDDEIEFKHAWKNGSWHCLEPVSFDLMRSDSIREKAHRVLGELTSIREAPERFKVYLLVGKPQTKDMSEAFEKALGILGKAPTEKEIISEDEAPEFLDRFAQLIVQHDDDFGRNHDE